MDFSRAALIVFIALILVIGLNAVIYFSLAKKSGKGENTVTLLRKAAGRIRNPWEIEDRDLHELSNRVTELSKKDKVSKDQ